MTVDEAKKKWCPMSHTVMHIFVNGDSEDTMEHADGVERKGNCIADRCMVWREAKVPVEFDGELVTKYETHGYCGMVRND